MKIVDVEAIHLRLPQIKARSDSSQDALLIRITTDSGLVGWGEADSSPSVVKAIIDAPMSHRWASGLREVVGLRGPQSRAARLADDLLGRSEEFRAVWELHEVGLRPPEVKHFVHRELGTLELTCQTLVDPAQSHSLLVYTAVPGTESHDKLQLLSVIGAQPLS